MGLNQRYADYFNTGRGVCQITCDDHGSTSPFSETGATGKIWVRIEHLAWTTRSVEYKIVYHLSNLIYDIYKWCTKMGQVTNNWNLTAHDYHFEWKNKISITNLRFDS